MSSKKKASSRVQARPIVKVAAKDSDLYLWLILGLALFLRAVYFKTSEAGPFYEPTLLDAKYYHDWATRIARGEFWSNVFYGLPLYPFFLGFVYSLFQESIVAAKVVQALLGLVTVFFTYKIGEEIDGKKTAWIAGLLAACYGPLIFHEQLFIPEAVGAPLYAASLYFVFRFLKSPSERSGAILGALLGLCMLSKAGIFLFVLIFLGSKIFSTDAFKFRRPAIICMTAFFLTLAPVTAHNMIRGKDAVLLTSHSGFNFYIGNNESAEGVFKAPEGTGSNVDAQIEDAKSVAERESGRPLKPSEVSRYWSDKGWVFIHEHPGKFLELCARKAALFFDSREISDVEDYQFASLFDPFLRLPWPNFALIGPFFFLGCVLGWKRMRHRGVILLWIGGYIVGMMAFFVNARYRVPLLSAILPIAALGAADFSEDFIEWRFPRVAIASAILIAAFGFTHLHLVGTNFSRDYVNAGDVWLQKKDPARALPLYDKSIELSPDNAKAYLAKAVALTSMGRDDEARPLYEKVISIDPKNSQAYNNLGLSYEKSGDPRTAEMHFLKAIELKPNSAQPHNNLGLVYGKRGDREKAIGEFEAALRINPADARAYTNLGLMHYQSGDKEAARRLWEKALSVDPQFADAQRALSLMQRTTSHPKD